MGREKQKILVQKIEVSPMGDTSNIFVLSILLSCHDLNNFSNIHRMHISVRIPVFDMG